MDDAEIQKQLRAAFQAESRERIEALYAGLDTLEKGAGNGSAQTTVETVFREAHSLKGAARSVNLPAIESVCQEMENIFAALKDEALPLTPELTDRLYAAVGLIEQATAPEASPDDVSDELKKMGGALRELKIAGPAPQLSERDAGRPDEAEPGDAETGGAEPAAAEQKEPAPETPAAEATEQTSSEAAARDYQPPASLSLQSVRVPAIRLDSLLLKAEELITVKQSSAQHLNQLNSLQDLLGQWQKQWERFQADSPRAEDRQGAMPDNEAAHSRTRQFLEDTSQVIRKLEQHLKQASAAFDLKRRHFNNLVDDLLDATKKTSLMPFSTLFSVFPRMVRDIARDSGKSVDLSLSGETVEVDKRILEGLKDPLMHLLRNAVDHGIEAPARRTGRGKPETGSIRITAFQPESSHVRLSISDDGAGIDTAAVIADALDKGLITAEAADTMEAPEALNLIFRSGISSTPRVTEISGRGLGMPIVREGIENLGGSIHLESTPGVGSTFHIRLPVTLATFRGILIEAGAQLFILPNAHVQNSLQLRREAIQTMEGQPAVFFQDRPLALVSLAELLGLPPAENKSGNQNNRKKHAHIPALILGNGSEALAVSVDRIINEQEILVKPLGKQLQKVRHIAGATVLGSGAVVPILNAGELIESAVNTVPAYRTAPAATSTEHHQEAKSLLVVEDSFTSRTLLKNILEASGYQVETAIDGRDGLSRLTAQAFDAVITDVEMPNMGGLELTEKIRSEAALSELPVILVTSLDSPKDRQRGVEVGANAYIVKGSFDQSNLLEALDRLL